MADGRRYWITTHDPHGRDDRWFVYRKQAGKAKGQQLRQGDGVLFYETGNRGPDGRKGRTGLVCAAEVTGSLRDRDPPKGEWIYEVPCSEPAEEATTPIGPARMLEVMGLRPQFPIFALIGLREITHQQYDTLRREMGLPAAG